MGDACALRVAVAWCARPAYTVNRSRLGAHAQSGAVSVESRDDQGGCPRFPAEGLASAPICLTDGARGWESRSCPCGTRSCDAPGCLRLLTTPLGAGAHRSAAHRTLSPAPPLPSQLETVGGLPLPPGPGPDLRMPPKFSTDTVLARLGQALSGEGGARFH